MSGQGMSNGERPNREARSGAAQRAYDKRTARLAGRAPVTSSATVTTSRRGVLRSRIPFVVSIIGLLSVGLAVTLLLTTRAAEDSYQLSDARAYNKSLVEQKSALERDFQSRNSAPELANEASALGMVPAKDPARLVVHPDGTVEVVGTPTPATPGALPPLDAPPTPNPPAPAPRVTTVPTVPVSPSTPPAATQNLAQSEQLIPVASTPPTPTTVVPEANR
ncbi:type II secretory pathway pseudopilin PulG [Rhodococcus sp. 27YEA15]|uniref:hypothetical protein n=1 Tax=Rhodococcus sp. 27YEA15 TaxID=3156259 RepID=UPI003C7EC6D5